MGAVVAYLGPEGTFAEAAAARVRTIDPAGFVPVADVESIADGVESGAFEFGVVPIENSVHGYVLPTLDRLVFVNDGVLVREEVVLDVTFTLWRNPGLFAKILDGKACSSPEQSALLRAAWPWRAREPGIWPGPSTGRTC